MSIPSSPPSMVMAFIAFIFSFLSFCDAPDNNSNIPAEIVNDKAVELILSAPSAELNEDTIATTVIVLEARLSYLAAEVEVLPDNRFLVKLPSSSLENQNVIISLATRQGRLRFQIVKEEFSDFDDLDLDMLEPSPFDSKLVTNATASIDDYSPQATVSFEIVEQQQQDFGNFTESNIGNRLAIVLDKEILTAPFIQASISSAGQIVGLDSLDQAQEYARIFNSGELAFDLSFAEIRLAAE